MASTMQMQGVGGPFVPLASLLVDAVEGAIDGLRTLNFHPLQALVRAQARAEQRRQLLDLEDRLLKDMGLDRATVLKQF